MSHVEKNIQQSAGFSRAQSSTNSTCASWAQLPGSALLRITFVERTSGFHPPCVLLDANASMETLLFCWQQLGREAARPHWRSALEDQRRPTARRETQASAVARPASPHARQP